MQLGATADWHLAPSGGKLDPETGLNARLMDRYRCAEWCIADMVKRGVDLILVAGDIFDSAEPTPTERWLALGAMKSAVEAGIPVLVLGGNHELAKSTAEQSATDLLNPLRSLIVADQPSIYRCDGERWAKLLPGDGRRWVELVWPSAGAKIQVACAPYPNKQQLLAFRPDLSVLGTEAAMREGMTDVIRGLAAQLEPGIPSILLGHFGVDLAKAGSESRMMVALGAEWTLNAHELAGMGFELICLGHVHKRQLVVEDRAGRSAMFYAGSPCQMDHGEEGDACGYLLHEFEDGRHAETSRHDCPYNRRYLTIDLATDSWPAAEDLREAIVKVRIPAGMEADEPQMRRELEAAGVQEYQITHQQAETLRRREVEISQDMDFETSLRAWAAQQDDIEAVDTFVAEAKALEEARLSEGADHV